MHFADTHFGVETYGRLDPATGINTRLADFRDSLCRVIDDALARGIDMALFAGDAYKGRDPSQTQQREFAHCIRKLTDAGVPVVMLTGNHDIPNVRGRAHAMEIYRALDVRNVHIIHRPELLTLETAAGPIQVAGMPYLMKGFMLAREEFLGKTTDEVRRMMEDRYAEQIGALAEELAPELPAVLVGHFWVSGARLSAWQSGYLNPNEPQVPLSVLTRPGAFDYVAMGHIHRRQSLNGDAHPPVVYCGSPDCIDFGERDEKKGYVYAEVSRGQTTWEFVEVAGCRPLVEIDVEADTETPTETIVAAIGRQTIEQGIVRLTYHLSAEKAPLIRDKEIREALQPAFLVAAIRADIQRDKAQRTRALKESLDPLEALKLYLEENQKSEKGREELMPYAEILFEELRREEAVA